MEKGKNNSTSASIASGNFK